MGELIEFLKQEWDTLSNAPLTFIVGWLLFTGIAFAFLRKLLIDQKDATIETLRERVAWAEEQRDFYKLQIAEFKEQEKAIAKIEPDDLQEKALELVGEIRSFLERHRRESAVIHGREREAKRAESEENRRRDWDDFTSRLMRLYTDAITEFDRRFKVRAILMRDQLLKRLPDYQSKAMQEHEYEHPTNPIGMGMIADDLEKMALQL